MKKLFSADFWLELYKNKTPKFRTVFIGSFSLITSQFFMMLVGLVITGLVARYLLPDEFGLWSILLSLTGVLAGFDLGFSNALRNRLTQLAARKDETVVEARAYFFSIFYLFLILGLVVSLVVVIARPFIPWQILFNTSRLQLAYQGSWLFAFGIGISAMMIAFAINGAGFFSHHESHWNALFGFLTKLGLLVGTSWLIYLKSSFFWLTMMFFLVNFFLTVLYFGFFLWRRQWPIILVKIAVLRQKIKELWNKSLQFSFLQIFANLYTFLDLVVIGKILGLAVVGDFSLAKKLYWMVITFHFAAILPLWAIYAEAAELGNFSWIKKILRKTVWLTILAFVTATLILVFMGNYIIYIWAGRKLTDLTLLLLLGIWSLLVGWNNCFSIFLNAVGRLKIQVISVGAGVLLLVPLASWFGRIWGLAGICLALILTTLPMAVATPIQVYLYFKEKEPETDGL